MDLRTGMMVAVGITVLLMTAFLIWKVTQTRPAQMTERSFYEFAKAVNESCDDTTGRVRTVMLYMPQTFPKESIGSDLWKKAIPGQAGDPYFQMYYEHFPKESSLTTSLFSMGWREDLPWTRDFTGFITTAALFEFGGEFALPLAMKPVRKFLGTVAKYSGVSTAYKGVKKLIGKVTPGGVTSRGLSKVFRKAGIKYGSKSLVAASYLVRIFDEFRYAVAKGAKIAVRKSKYLKKVFPKGFRDKFWTDKRMVKRVMNSDHMQKFLSGFIEGKQKTYEEMFKILKKYGLASRKMTPEGEIWELTKTGKAVVDEVGEAAKEKGVGTLRYSDFMVEKKGVWKTIKNWKGELAESIANRVSRKYSTFLPKPIKKDIGRTMLELSDSQRIKFMKMLDGTTIKEKVLKKMPQKVRFRFGKFMREKLEDYMTNRKVVKETLEEMRKIKLKSGTFDEIKDSFIDSLSRKKLKIKDIVPEKYWDELDKLGWDKSVDKVKTVNIEDVTDAIDGKYKKKIVKAMEKGDMEKARNILTSKFRENLKYDIMYSKYMDDFSKVLTKESGLVGVPKDSVASLLLEIDQTYTDLPLEVVEKGKYSSAIDKLTKKLIEEGKLSTRISDDVVERNIKRYVILKEARDLSYAIEDGFLKNWDEVKREIKPILKKAFPNTWGEELPKMKEILESSISEDLLRQQIGQRGQSLGNGIWRLWMLEISEGNADEARRFMDLASGKVIGIDLRAPATYGLLRGTSYLEEKYDQAIGSFYHCDKHELCLTVGKKTYSYKIDKKCEVRLDRNVPIVNGLDDPRFYLVSPCYAELELTKTPYQSRIVVSQHNKTHWEDGEMDNTQLAEEIVEHRKDLLIEEYGEETDLINRLKKEGNFEGKTDGVIIIKEGEKLVEYDKDGLSDAEEEQLRNDQGFINETEGVIKEGVEGDAVELKEGETEGSFISKRLSLPMKDNKGNKYDMDVLAGEVSVNLSEGCIDVEVLDAGGTTIDTYGDCDTADRGLCNGTFDFEIKPQTRDRLPEEFYVKFNFRRKNPQAESPKLLQFTVSRVKNIKGAVMIKPNLCKNIEEYKDNVMLRTEYGGGVIQQLWENRQYPNYCYASSSLVNAYMGKEYGAMAVSMLGVVPGVNVVAAVVGGVAIQAYGETFMGWPYAYTKGTDSSEEESDLRGVPVKTGKSCPLH